MSNKNSFVEIGYTTSGDKFNRNKFVKVNKVNKSMPRGVKDSYQTFFRYEKPQGDGKLEGDFVFDFDNEKELEEPLNQARSFANAVLANNCPKEAVKFFFSGAKGFHIVIAWEALGLDPRKDLANLYKWTAEKIKKDGNLSNMDTVIYEKRRLFRLPNTTNSKTGLFKIPLTFFELNNLPVEQIQELARKPREIAPNGEISTIWQWAKDNLPKAERPTKKSTTSEPKENIFLPLEGTGERNNKTFARAISFRIHGYNLDEAITLCKQIKDDPPLDERDIVTTVTSAYRSNYLTDIEQKKEVLPDKEYIDTFLNEIERRKQYNKAGKFVGLDTGFEHLNEITLGLQTGLWIIGARPSLGKTTFVRQLLDQVVMNNPGIPALFISYEQSKFELMLKTISRFAEVNSRLIQKGRFIGEEETSLMEGVAKYYKFADRVYVNEAEGAYTTTDRIKEISLKIMEQHGSEKLLIVVDYLQLVPINGIYRSDKERLDKACSNLRRIARDLNSPVVAVSSLNRPAYGKKGKADLASFKESGGIEYSSDLAFVMEEEEPPASLNAMGKPIKVINLKIMKNRNGERGKIQFIFNMGTSTFTETTKSELEDTVDIDF